VALVTLLVFLGSLPAQYAAFQHVCSAAPCARDDLTPERVREIEALGLSVRFFAAAFLSAEVLFVAIWYAVGSIIFWRRSNDRAALFVALFLVTFSTGIFLSSLADRLAGTPAGWLITAIIGLGWMCFYLFFFLFPDGRFVPRWSSRLAAGLIVLGGGELLFPNLAVLGWLSPLRLAPFLVLLLGGIAAQVYRYWRVSDAVQRQQTRLVLLSVIGAMTVLAAAQITLLLIELPSVLALLAIVILIYLALLIIPLMIGVAILRYQLWEIRVLISRTLSYGALTACVVGMYVLLVGALGQLFQASGNALISLLATGLIAVLFQPLREWLQRAVNRLVYGEREDPYAVLAGLGRRLEENLAPDAVLPTIVETIAQALKLQYAAIVLDQQGSVMTAASVGAPVGGELQLPLMHSGELIGQMLLGPGGRGQHFSAADLRLLEDLTAHVGAAVYSVRLTADLQKLTADLQQSREQLVGAREEERRRLRRDLHDEVGPTLASLIHRLETARALVPRDPDGAQAVLSELKLQVKTTIGDIRRLVYALRPPTLDELGLVSAIREHAAHYQAGELHVVVEAPEQLPALPAAVEVAVYRIVLEALTNVTRHAHASSCQIRLELTDARELLVEVIDDGVGLADRTLPGVGMASMRERAAELGGECRVDARSEGGTRVRARLPL
jgi:signal transduction histidine kinase